MTTSQKTKILGIDPGQTTGWATILMDEDKYLELEESGQTKDMQLIEIIDHIRSADLIVYEGWWTNPKKAKKGDFNWRGNEAEEVIGALLTLAKLHQKDIPAKQQPSQRIAGYAWAGMTYVQGKKGCHWQDALAHAVHFAVRRKGAFPLTVKKS
jgi:hypothetical protein